MATEVVAKRWGNSIGIILPKDLVDSRGIRENDRILVEVVRKPDLKKIVASLPKARFESGQQFKDRVRAGWS